MIKKRVELRPKDTRTVLDLAKKVYEKHLADGDASLLKALKWHEVGPTLEQAMVYHERAEKMKREMLEAYQSRDILYEPILNIVRDSRDILTGAMKKEMKKLGQWGYNVIEPRNVVKEAVAVNA